MACKTIENTYLYLVVTRNVPEFGLECVCLGIAKMLINLLEKCGGI